MSPKRALTHSGATADQYIPEPHEISCEQDQSRAHAWPATIEITKHLKVSSRNGDKLTAKPSHLQQIVGRCLEACSQAGSLSTGFSRKTFAQTFVASRPARTNLRCRVCSHKHGKRALAIRHSKLVVKKSREKLTCMHACMHAYKQGRRHISISIYIALLHMHAHTQNTHTHTQSMNSTLPRVAPRFV